jgi:hypothetical protein
MSKYGLILSRESLVVLEEIFKDMEYPLSHKNREAFYGPRVNF